MQAEAYVTLAARYETPLYSYAARMLGGLRDGERCLVAALATAFSEAVTMSLSMPARRMCLSRTSRACTVTEFPSAAEPGPDSVT